MSMSLPRVATRPESFLGAWSDLLRARMGIFVAFATYVGGVAVAPGAHGAALLAALYVTATAAAASAFNQLYERETDALMERTAQRPLVTGALRTRDAIFVAGALAVFGIVGLALSFNLLAALFGLGTLTSYTLIYTPLKRVSSLNTVIGAVPGAMPPLLGATALAGVPSGWGWDLFALLFVWQFPHFMAIAWLYRKDYAAAGMKMLPAMPGGERAAGRAALSYGLLILPISLLPALRGAAGPVYVVAALLLGLAYVGTSAAFALRQDRGRARLLLFTSLAYLPLILLAVLADPVVRLSSVLTTP